MSVSKISNRYAKSLIDLAREKNILEDIIEDVTGFLQAADNKDFVLFLKSPIINGDKKEKVFEELFGKKVHQETMAFFKMVIKKGRENILPQILNRVLEAYKEMKGITTVTITSATELTVEEFDRISNKLTEAKLASDNVEFIKKIDSSIIGGFIIEIGDKLYDASIAGKMKKLKKELI
jgi:F-type H+-transporting ATPase subunit delta